MTMYSSYHRRTGRNAGSDLGGGFFVQTGGNAYALPSSAAATGSNPDGGSKGRRRRNMLFAALYGSLGLLAVYTNVFDMRLPTSFADLRRKLASIKCITNIYATADEVVNLPAIPEQDDSYLPSYIKLCYEWMRREAFPDVTYNNFHVLENQDICVDWSAPHYAMMEIVASQILSAAIPVSGISYAHGCAEFRSSTEVLLGFDYTPFQTIYQQAGLGVDAAANYPNGIEDLRSICKIALQAYDSEKEKSHDRSRAVHHPFAFPTTSLMDSGYPMEPSDVRKELTDLPESPGIGNERLAPITAVARQLHNRFHADAENWVGVTNPPPNEKYTGVVIMVDNASREMDPAILNEYIPQEVTSISILASPLCLYSTPLETGSSCLGYVDELFGYFNSAYGTALSGNGPDGGPGVTSKIIPSTAAGMARPMTTNTLLCPPHTLSCLPAALGKVPQLEEPDPPIPSPPLPTTILFDVPESVAAASFVDKIGRCGADNYGGACIRVIQLATIETSQTVTGTPDAPVPEPVQDTPSGEPAAKDFSTAQEPTDSEGFVTTDPNYSTPAPTPPLEETAQKTAYDVTVASTEEIVSPAVGDGNTFVLDAESSPAVETNDGTVEEPASEIIFTEEQVTTAVSNNLPLDGNAEPSTAEKEGEPPQSVELVVTEDEKLETSFLDTVTYNDLIAERMLSQGRIADANYVKSDPQVYCPPVEYSGNVQNLTGGYIVADNGGSVVVSTTEGIVTFEAPVTIESLVPQVGEFVDPDTLDTYTDQYITVYDAVLQDYVRVTDSVISSNGTNIVVDHSIGRLYVDPSTNHGYLLLDGAAVDLSDGADTHTLIEGTVQGVGGASVPLTPQGTVTVTKEGGREVTGQQDTVGFTTTTNPEEQPMAPENVFQMPPDTESVPFVTRQTLAYDQCITPYDDIDPPIHIRSHSTDNGITSIIFDVAQVYKVDDISWVAVDIPNDPSSPTTSDGTCLKVEDVGPGFDDQLAGFSAQCDAGGQLIVDVHIHDGNKAIGQIDIAAQGKCKCPRSIYKNDPQRCIDDYNCSPDRTYMVPERCEPSNDIFSNNKCHFRYAVNCNAYAQAAPARRRLQSIDPSQEGDEEPLFGGSNVFGKCTHRRTKRADGTVVYRNFKFGNGIQNANLNVEGVNGNERGLRGPVRRHNLEVIDM